PQAAQERGESMTKILHRDLDRRCKPLDEWPAADRALWQAALMPGDLFDDGGARARHSEISNRNAVYGYGRWLTCLDRHGWLDDASSPADRITPARVRAYIPDLERHNATQTVLNRLQELYAVALVMDPDRDWSWIHRFHSHVRTRHRPARPKRARLVPVWDLFNLGLSLMASAEQETTPCKRAMVFRDGLIIALLALRPLRLRNLAGLVLDSTLVLRGNRWWIQIPASETKTKKEIDVPWPEALAPALETYITRHRPVLASMWRGSVRPVGQALWVSTDGSPMGRQTIYATIVSSTRDGLGRRINPQLVRDCAVTSIAIEAPDDIGIASPLLGHQGSATTEKYYNQARGIEAARRLQKVVLSRR
ncbi:MAG TPA: tyrosine-type recombinase/integrase, partial [Stellaceae bacterium]